MWLKNGVILLCLSIMGGGMFLSEAKAASASMQVVLYPSGGRVEETAELPIEDGVVRFELPFGADLESLTISVDGGQVTHRETVPVTGSEPPALMALRAEWQEARKQAAALEGELAALQSRINLWTLKTAVPEAVRSCSVDEMEKLDGLVTARLKDLYQQIATLEPRQKEALHQVQLLEQALARYGDVTTVTRVTAWIELGKTVKTQEKKVRVRYSYQLEDCGWKPVYLLDADPEKKQIHITLEAEIRQGTGRNWENAAILLSTGNLYSGLTPRPVPEWILRLYEPRPRPSAAMEATVGASFVDSAPVNAMQLRKSMVAPAAENATTSTWDLGFRNIPAGTPVRLELLAKTWTADFLRVARPLPSGQEQPAYLMADVHLAEPQELPNGSAHFLVDGLAVGTGAFSLSGDTKKIFFGPDRRVLVAMKPDVRQSGRKGFVDKEQTRSWKWNIEIRNAHTTPVRVRIEDAEPQSADQAIRLKVTATPKPEVEEHLNVWTLDVPASGKSVIVYAVEASAPADKRFSEGR